MKDNLNLMKVGWNDWWWVYEMRWLLTRPAIQFIDFFSILLFENEKIEEINRIDGLWAAASGLSINEIDWMERCKCWLPSLDSLPAAVMGGGTANGSAKGKTNKKSNQQRNQIMSELIVGWLELNLVEWNENKTADQSHQSMNGAPSASAVSSSTHSSSLLPLREMKSWNEVEGERAALLFFRQSSILELAKESAAGKTTIQSLLSSFDWCLSQSKRERLVVFL